MIRQNSIQPTFVGGEVTPRLLGRADTERFLVCGATIENFIVRHQGPMFRRRGTQLVLVDTCDATRLTPFTFSRDDSEIIRFGCGEIIIGT